MGVKSILWQWRANRASGFVWRGWREIFGRSRQEVIEGRGKVLNVELCNLYAFPEFVIKWNRWDGQEGTYSCGVSLVVIIHATLKSQPTDSRFFSSLSTQILASYAYLRMHTHYFFLNPHQLIKCILVTLNCNRRVVEMSSLNNTSTTGQ